MKAQQRYIHDIKKVFQFTGYRDRKYLKDLNQQINEFVLEFAPLLILAHIVFGQVT